MNGLTMVAAGTKLLAISRQVIVAATFQDMANKFAGVVAGVLSSVGIIMCLWGGFNFAMSLESRDNTQKISGAITFFSGILMIMLPQLVTYISGQTVTADFNW